ARNLVTNQCGLSERKSRNQTQDPDHNIQDAQNLSGHGEALLILRNFVDSDCFERRGCFAIRKIAKDESETKQPPNTKDQRSLRLTRYLSCFRGQDVGRVHWITRRGWGRGNERLVAWG